MTNEQKELLRKLDQRSRMRLRWIIAYEQIKKVSPVCRYFGVSRSTFYVWYQRYLSFGIEGLKDRSTRPHKISNKIPQDIVQTVLTLRNQRKYGPKRMSYYLKERYNWYISKTTIWRMYKEYGLNRLKYKRKWQRYPQKYSKPLPGERIQVDVKFIDNLAFEGKRYYQFTAIDDCTRYRVLRIYDRNNVKNATDFVNQVKKVLPFAIKQVQTDNGSEFSEEFSWHLQDLGISHRKTKVRSPEENGKVERSHRTDNEEFYLVNRFVSIQHCIKLLKEWEKEYNEKRPHMALQGKTPKEYLMEKLQNHALNRTGNLPVKSVRDVP
jgi:transposase InsO family protein